MQTVKYYLKVIWVWLKGVLNAQNDSDLLWLLINKLITPDAQALLIELIREAARMDMSSSEKKRYVLTRLEALQTQLQTQLQTNIYLIRPEIISMAVNMLVEYLQLRGELRHHTETEVKEVKNEV